ncbi:MAG: nucleotidyltransferase domain-containing protein [Bryobacteraceae bacterium]
MATLLRLPIDETQLFEYCRRWKITKLEVFGSARFDWAAANDVDLLVSFAAEAQWSLMDHVEMQQELGELLDRPVDLVTRRSIEASHNTIRRAAILNDTVEVYATK